MLSAALLDALQRFTRTLTTDYVAEDELDALMQSAAEELSVDGAGIMLEDDEGYLRFVAASNETVRLIETFQVETDEGPCVRSAKTGRTVFASDLTEGDPRFPLFAAKAVSEGLNCVHSFPMLVEQECIGAMNLYRAEPGGLTDAQKDASTMFADMATTLLMSARRVSQATQMVDRIRDAMGRSAPIEQAKGYLIATQRVSPAEAFELIRGHARRTQAKVDVVSQQLLDGQITVDDLR